MTMSSDPEQPLASDGPLTTPGATEDDDSEDLLSPSPASSDTASILSQESAVSERAPSSTKSLEASTIEYIFENDRQYCNETYHMPNDEAEQTRLNILHQLYLLVQDGKFTLAPLTLTRPQATSSSRLSYPSTASSSSRIPRLRILDIGTGPADWAIAMAEQYPAAEVVATDISPALHPESIPSNLFLEIDDATLEWTFAEQFDLIHIRNMADSFPDWPFIFREAYKHLRPGGYIEVCDHAGLESLAALLPNSYISIYTAATQSAAECAGMYSNLPTEKSVAGSAGPAGGSRGPAKGGTLAHLHPHVLEAAGFKNVHVTKLHVPLGTWPKDEQRPDPRRLAMGKMWLIVVLEGLEASSLRRLTRELAWTVDAVRDLCEKTREEIMACHETKRCETEFRAVVAQKPEL
ncbi:S-adenosyl-L-methionine-dependent methyltransferase [Xylona heveae TC161]|uniref:S-adenosyl-L-methionine-dependent methyltransferase n=1 Tax=Xylona heveae (strain CBS 132557 / TC161) TaxID=1328760 RepID=A0A164ZID0_XYLHT|nr:S-adenosyl-L-methionine-dependent methyltransferase [Xylona heveae TC161]KZF19135.1 S-adenosyl-L-methionine-dependent methyltransferase [Xylona heveae TC161]